MGNGNGQKLLIYSPPQAEIFLKGIFFKVKIFLSPPPPVPGGDSQNQFISGPPQNSPPRPENPPHRGGIYPLLLYIGYPLLSTSEL